MHSVVFLIPILISLGLFALIFGIVYMSKRENLAMIEKGLNPKQFSPRSASYRTLKWGLLMVGSGVGLLLAYLIDVYAIHSQMEQFPLYFSLITIGGGLGLVGSFLIEKKDTVDKENHP